jgi:hypothetical protein
MRPTLGPLVAIVVMMLMMAAPSVLGEEQKTKAQALAMEAIISV